MDFTSILANAVDVLKTAQTSGGLPSVDVNTNIALDNQTIVKVGGALLAVGFLTVGALLLGLWAIFKDKQ